MRRASTIAVAIALAGCVPVDQSGLVRGAFQAAQRTVVVIYPCPGPLITEEDSKAESAAKIVPGLGLIVQSAQDDRDLAASKDLQQYLPPFKLDAEFSPILMKELEIVRIPGRFVPVEQSELAPPLIAKFNEAKDVVDWRQRYFEDVPGRPPARDYSKILSLDDATILEIDAAAGLAQDGDGNGMPTFAAHARLYRASTMQPLWRRAEELKDDNVAAKMMISDYKLKPAQLIDRWKGLMRLVASKLADDLRADVLKTPAATIALPNAPAAGSPAPPPAAPR